MSEEKDFYLFNIYIYSFIYLFRADEDHDQLLSKEELINYVFKNVQLHLKEAKEKNLQLFVILDTNQNG